jgi:hypothetical protein
MTSHGTVRFRSRLRALYGRLGDGLGPHRALGWRAVYLVHGALLLLALAGTAVIPRPPGGKPDSAPTRCRPSATLTSWP